MKLTEAQYKLFKLMLERRATIFYWNSQGGSSSLIWEGRTVHENVNLRIATVKSLLEKGFIERIPPNDEVNYYIRNYPADKNPNLDPRHYGITQRGLNAFHSYGKK